MSNSIATQQRRHLKLAPDNNLEEFKPVSAQNILKFTIADTQALLQTKDLRLNFDVEFFKDAGGTSISLGDDINIDANTGFSSLIDQVYISSLRFSTGQQLEAIHDQARLSASMYSALFSPKHQRSNVYMEQRSIGKASYNEDDAGKRTDSAATDPFYRAQRRPLLSKIDCSMRINSGVLMSQPDGIDLSQLGGLRLDIYLQPNISAVLFGADVTSDAFYKVSNVSLSAPLLYKSAQQIAQDRASPKTSFNFLHYTSIYGVIDSTVSTLSHKVNFNGLVSVVQNSIAADHINNKAVNNNALEDFGSLRSVRFSRNGQRYPLEYDVVNEVESSRDVPANSTNASFNQLLELYLGAYKNPEDIHRTSVCPQTIMGQPAKEDGNFGVGVGFDNVSGGGIAVNGNLSYNYSSKLEDEDGADRTLTTPYGIYSYYLNRSVLATNPQQGIVAVN